MTALVEYGTKYLCLVHRRTSQEGEEDPRLGKFQGKLCFQGKR